MKRTGKVFGTLAVTSVAAASAVSMAAVATTSGASSGLAKGAPVTIGISLSLSGDFSADGIAYEQGYKLWASDVNKAGGLLGHKVKLDIVSDASDPTQVQTNYQKLISTDHANLVFGPFSSLLTIPAAKTAAKTGAGAPVSGSAPEVAFGKAITSRMLSRPARIATNRSIPIAIPPCGGAPYLRASKRNPKRRVASS